MFKKATIFLTCLPLLFHASEEQSLTPRTLEHLKYQQEIYQRKIEDLQTQLLMTTMQLEFITTYPRLWIDKQCQDRLIGVARGEEESRKNRINEEALDRKKIQDNMRYPLMSFSRMVAKH